MRLCHLGPAEVPEEESTLDARDRNGLWTLAVLGRHFSKIGGLASRYPECHRSLSVSPPGQKLAAWPTRLRWPPPHGSCQTTVPGPAFAFPHRQVSLQKVSLLPPSALPTTSKYFSNLKFFPFLMTHIKNDWDYNSSSWKLPQKETKSENLFISYKKDAEDEITPL